ncbi:uncharacterized protein LOC110734941 [Chenopodium quinoa]|uniref:uncharacterized protein LOC110734941 n=1 Tax=Chenopodium quinoa TaxID=63459 RepID=UPI000B77CD9F|nr:uncharacterized protein LOC110734941 [Chenopodium quinoa]
MQLDLSGTFHTPNREKGTNNRDDTHDLDSLDAGTPKKDSQEGAEEGKVEKMVKEYLKTIEAKIAKIPGMPKPMEEEAADGYIESPFSEEIAMVEVPKRFSTPNMTMYDGTTDPDEHVSLYKQKMMTNSIPRDIREAIMCKGFGATLSGPALTWFNREKIGIHKCDAPTTIEAFRRGLLDHSELYKELTKYPCTTFEDVQDKAMAQVRFEEDAYARKTPELDRQSRRNNNFPRRDHRFKSYQRSRIDEGTVNVVEEEFSDWREDPELPPKLHEYCFNVNPTGVIRTLNKMGDTVQWPRKSERLGEKKDPSRWCDFHSDIAKRHAKESNKDQPDKREKSKIDIPIMFEESDVIEGHHDGLVISLPVGNCMIKRILVDNGSSANIIMLDTLKHMNIDKKNIVNKSTMLVGFSGETKKTSGEITLATCAKGINLQVKFLVIDTLSSYNMILGRPWIHEMKAIPSTYHQVIKFPTRWGIQEIRGDPREAKECYKIALQATSSEKSSA